MRIKFTIVIIKPNAFSLLQFRLKLSSFNSEVRKEIMESVYFKEHIVRKI